MNKYISSEEFIFNTKVFQQIYTEGVEAYFILDKSVKLMKDLETTLSFYNENSDIDKINKNAGKNFVKVSRNAFEIISKSKSYSQLTKGLFDITIAPLVKLWGVNSSNPQVISNNKIEKLIPLVNYNDIILDNKNLQIMLANENQKIDLGGIAKGYIADLIIDFYKENDVKSAMINIGGNIKVLGKKNDLTSWKVGIYEPVKHSNNILCSIDVEDMSVVTSGVYERAFIKNNKLYHHILNPKTGYPANTDLKSITIINEDSLLCDGLSTPLLIMGKYKASQFMKKNNISGIMITDDNKIIISKDLLKNFNLHSQYEVFCF